MRTILWVASLLLVSLGPVVRLDAKDIFVNNLAGDDRSNGSQPQNAPGGAGPLRTIAKALHEAEMGDRVVLANTAQPYRESISLVGSRHSGNVSQPFVIDGNGAILDGSAPVPAWAWENYRGPVFRFAPTRVEFQGLFLNDRPAERVASNPAADRPPNLKPLQWSLHGAYLYFCVEKDKLPDAYPLTYAEKPVGITLYRVQHVLIQDLIVQGFQRDGVNGFNSARQVDLVRLTCRGNGRSGVTVGGASLVDIDSCLIGNNSYAQLLTQPWSETHIRTAHLLSNTAPAWIDEGGRVFRDGKQIKGGLNESKAHTSQPKD
jgi:hypothetical protein